MEKDQLVQSRLPFGKHERAFLYQGTPDYRNIISSEASGDLIERLPNIRDKRGETLVMGKRIEVQTECLLTNFLQSP